MNIEFVTHCWQYSRLLAYQLTSFALNAPSWVTVTIFYAEEDEKTTAMVKWFVGQQFGVRWNPQPMSRERLCRRAIGRNQAALETLADWVWFADCDYWFGAKLFPALEPTLTKVPNEHVLVYPTKIAQTSQIQGDLLINQVVEPGMCLLCSGCDLEIDFNRFRKAIGGVQIVRGDYARLNGYLKSYKRAQKPTSRWARNVEDGQFRDLVGNSGYAVKLPDIVRVRHSQRSGYGEDVIN